LQDHAFLPNQFFVNTSIPTTFTWENFTETRNPQEFEAVSSQYSSTGMGELANIICNHVGWLRVNDSDFELQGFTDPSAGPGSGHYEFIINVCIS